MNGNHDSSRYEPVLAIMMRKSVHTMPSMMPCSRWTLNSLRTIWISWVLILFQTVKKMVFYLWICLLTDQSNSLLARYIAVCIQWWYKMRYNASATSVQNHVEAQGSHTQVSGIGREIHTHIFTFFYWIFYCHEDCFGKNVRPRRSMLWVMIGWIWFIRKKSRHWPTFMAARQSSPCTVYCNSNRVAVISRNSYGSIVLPCMTCKCSLSLFISLNEDNC